MSDKLLNCCEEAIGVTNLNQKAIEGVFFVHGQTVIQEDWCPLCDKWTKFGNAVNIEMDRIEKRKMNCGHEMTYIFLVEQICGDSVKVVRRRIR